jgi:hypothetical protein
MYAIQWKDTRAGTWLLCSTKGQAEVYDSMLRAAAAVEKWKESGYEADEYRIVEAEIVFKED